MICLIIQTPEEVNIAGCLEIDCKFKHAKSFSHHPGMIWPMTWMNHPEMCKFHHDRNNQRPKPRPMMVRKVNYPKMVHISVEWIHQPHRYPSLVHKYSKMVDGPDYPKMIHIISPVWMIWIRGSFGHEALVPWGRQDIPDRWRMISMIVRVISFINYIQLQNIIIIYIHIYVIYVYIYIYIYIYIWRILYTYMYIYIEI